LLGHISIGLRMVAEKLGGLPGFPPALRSLVEHMILSHHGQLEFGSPKLPQFPEALLLHYLDDMDSKMECMRALIENDRQVEGCFTTFSTAMERSALKKDRYLNSAPEPACASLPSAAPDGHEAQPQAAAAPPAIPTAAAADPLFGPRSDSLFGEKLKHALTDDGPKQES
jgi:3'-5' exoribonuclease